MRLYILFRDGQEIARGTEAEMLRKLHSTCPASWDHALQHEGYTLVSETTEQAMDRLGLGLEDMENDFMPTGDTAPPYQKL